MSDITISNIKYNTRESSPHFFSPDTLGFFGQTMSSFKVETVKGRVFIYAPSYRLFGEHMGRLMGYTFREYKAGQLLMVRNNDCLLYTSPSPRDRQRSRMPSSA